MRRDAIFMEIWQRESLVCAVIFFTTWAFTATSRNITIPRNSYLNQVLERRTGIPITLSALTMTVGRRAGLRIEGIGLPGHFIVKAVADNEEVLVDPFHGGRRLSEADCENLVRQATGVAFEVSAVALQGLPVGSIVRRLLANLKGIYLNLQDYSRGLRVMERMHQLNPQDVVLRRDLGATLVKVGQFGKAIDHLRVYLSQAPEADDTEVIGTILKRARAAVSPGYGISALLLNPYEGEAGQTFLFDPAVDSVYPTCPPNNKGLMPHV